MFLGIFSSLIPYLLAGGIYLLYLLFSLAQPYFSKNQNTQEDPAPRVINEDANTDYDELSNTVNFEDYYDLTNDTDLSGELPKKVFYPPGAIPPYIGPFHEIVIPSKDSHFHYLYSRPPPAC